MTISSILADLERYRIIPVVAIESKEHAVPLAAALTEGGLPCAEITLRTDAAVNAIDSLAQRSGFLVGAGTVHSADQARRAVDAGARFVVTPGFNPKTVAWCLDHGVLVIPGTSSPTDLEMAIEFGLHVVKFFPAEQLGGVKMLNALSGPYAEIRFVPTGGIHPTNVHQYLSLPSVLACGGTWMTKPDLLATGNFKEVTRLTGEAVQSTKEIQ